MKTPPNLIPLAYANLCHNCQIISERRANCPKCGSTQLTRLEPMLGRVPAGQDAIKIVPTPESCEL